MKRSLTLHTRSWPLVEPFTIARGTLHACESIIVHIVEGDSVGRGEAVGVDYHGETLAGLHTQIESVRRDIESGVGRRELIELLPAGGARNALDAALWDLEAKLHRIPAWKLAGLEQLKPLPTCITIGIRALDGYESRARMLARHEWIKVKVAADNPIAAVEAVRRGAPRSRLVVDANQAWSLDTLQRLAPRLVELRVDLLEQPVSQRDGGRLPELKCPLPICADEPVNTPEDLPSVVGRYDFINIKLDKSGGLTAALDLAYAAREAGLRLMVGCMMGSSLAMAPAMLLAQLCEVADLDGPLLQDEDWPNPIVYREGVMSPPIPALWG
jgi:L-alanine-DL-glutamate epimerase-like enolase superfamily enzyme